MEQFRQLLNETEARERLRQLGIERSGSAMRQMRHNGNGPRFVRVVRDIRYPIGEVEAWARRQISPLMVSTKKATDGASEQKEAPPGESAGRVDCTDYIVPSRRRRGPTIRAHLARKKHREKAFQILCGRLQEALAANRTRGLVPQVACLAEIVVMLAAMPEDAIDTLEIWISALFAAVKQAKRLFEDWAEDRPTLAACYELEGTIAAVRAVKGSALEDFRWPLNKLFDCSVPAEKDPIAGPQIESRVTDWERQSA